MNMTDSRGELESFQIEAHIQISALSSLYYSFINSINCIIILLQKKHFNLLRFD